MSGPSAPAWLTPATPGMLSNRRGSNLTTDALTLQARYRNPVVGGAPGTIRVVATRTVQAGLAQNPETAWDSGFVGTPATSPSIGTGAMSCAVTYNGRVYTIDTTNDKIYSAPITGGSIGPSRLEGSMASLGLTTPLLTFSMVASPAPTFSATVLFGRLFLTGQAGWIASIPILPGGYLGQGTLTLVGSITANSVIVSYQVDATTGWLLVMNTTTPNAFTIAVTNSGLTLAAPVATTAPSVRANPGVFLDAVNGALYLLGGDVGGVVVATTARSPVTLATGALGAWAAGNVLPAARSGPAIAYVPGVAPSSSQWVYLIGGGTAINGGTPQTTVYSAQVIVGSLTFVAEIALTTAVSMVGGFCWAGWLLLAEATFPSIAVLASTGLVIQASVTDGIGGNAAWVSGAHTLVVGSLGTGGVITANQDGSYSLTFLWAAFRTGIYPTYPLLGDGDQVQISVQFTDTNGNPSPPSTTTVKIGQPPTITAQATGLTVAVPTPLLTYVQGAGGALEQTWQVVVRKHSDSSLVFDSGVVAGSVNSVLANIAPYLLNAVLYDITYTVASFDVPIDGNSSNSGTAAGTVTPAYGTMPLQPTGLTVTT
jgi:hypothetical protein